MLMILSTHDPQLRSSKILLRRLCSVFFSGFFSFRSRRRSSRLHIRRASPCIAFVDLFRLNTSFWSSQLTAVAVAAVAAVVAAGISHVYIIYTILFNYEFEMLITFD